MQEQPQDQPQSDFLKRFLQRLQENPDLTLSAFMLEIEQDEALSTRLNAILDEQMATVTPDHPKDDELVADDNLELEEEIDLFTDTVAVDDTLADNNVDDDLSDEIADEGYQSLSDLVASTKSEETESLYEKDNLVDDVSPASSTYQTVKVLDNDMPDAEPTPIAPVKPAFSFRQWYADHSIDFILYLGAFMIVAAVSLFVGFQWQNLDSITRFGIVVGFTATWYVAGIAIQRFMALDNVGIAFITIGAVITPFCGVAWQRFVVDSLANVGLTWFITAIVSTTIYLIVSLVYQRRYFTYFGNLSILALVLSLVEITASPIAYYVLAGTVTSLILLIARLGMAQLAPRLDAYLGTDVQYSSWAMMGVSVIAGIVLLPITGLDFFSIEVLVVMATIPIYLALTVVMYPNIYVMNAVQIAFVGTVATGLVVFNIGALPIVWYYAFVGLITSLVILVIWQQSNFLERFFKPDDIERSVWVGIGIASVLSVVTIILNLDPLLSSTALLGLFVPSLLIAGILVVKFSSIYTLVATKILLILTLASLLFLLGIGALPMAWYYVFCGTLITLILLIVWLRSSRLQNMFIQDDFMLASWITMGVSVVAGGIFLPQTGLAFHSIPIFVLFLTLPIYLALTSYLYPNMFTLIATQVTAIIAIAHALVTFNIGTLPIEWYYAFCGTALSLLLLIAWYQMPRLQAHFAKYDFLWSSWATMGFFVIVGGGFLLQSELDIYSLPVFVIILSIPIYLVLTAYHHPNLITLILALASFILTLATGLVTFNIGTLSIEWYYAFCGTTVSLLLLIAWMRAPVLDVRFKPDDIEMSLFAVMALFTVGAVILLAQTGLAFYGIPVLVVLLPIPIYLCLVAYLYPVLPILIATQASSIFVIATVLITFNLTSLQEIWVYVFCGVVISLLLLIAWIRAPQLDERFQAVRIEQSLWIVMLVSVLLGFVPLLGISTSIFTLNGLILLSLTLIYLCLVIVIHPEDFVILGAQVLFLLTLAYGLITFEIDPLTALYILLGSGLILQAGLTRTLQQYQPITVPTSEVITLAMLTIVYGFALVMTDFALSALPIGVILLVFTAYYANRVDNYVAWVYLSILPYVLLTHIWIIFYQKLDNNLLIPAFIIGLAQVATIRLTNRRKMVESFVYIGLFVIGAISLSNLSQLVIASLNNTLWVLYAVLPFTALVSYCAVMLADDASEEPILAEITPYILGGVSLVYYGLAFINNYWLNNWQLVAFAILASLVFWIAYRTTKNDKLYFPVFIAPYFALFHVLDMFGFTLETFVLGNTILSLIIYFANVLPAESRFSRQIVAMFVTFTMTGLGLSPFFMNSADNIASLSYAGWISGYSLLSMMWIVRRTENSGFITTLVAIGGLLMYYWHVIYLATFVNPAIFGDMQWYTAAFGGFLLILASIQLQQGSEYEGDAPLMMSMASIILIAPTLWQIFFQQSLIYFLLGIVYSLLIVAVSITFSQSRLRTFGSVMLIFVVLLQTREFLFGLPRWLVVGIVGFGLLGVGLYLSLRRRDVKKVPKGIEE